MTGNIKIAAIAGIIALVVIYLNNQDMLPAFFKPKVEEPEAPAGAGG